MAKNMVIILLVVLFIGAVIAGGQATEKAYDRGFVDGSPLILDPPTPSNPSWVLPEYEPPMTDDERIMVLLEKFMGEVETANISIEWDDSGNTKGSMSIFYNNKDWWADNSK